MLLSQLDVENRARGEGHGLFEREHGLSRLIAQTWSNVDPPRGVVTLIDCKRDRAGNAPSSALILKDRFKHGLRWIDIRRSLNNLDLCRLIRSVSGRGLHLEFRQSKHAFWRASRPPARQIRIG